MSRKLKQSIARNILVFMASSSDHITGKTGLTLTITESKAAGAFAATTPTVTERSNGWYQLALTGTNLDTLGDYALHITGTDADPTDVLMEVVAYNAADAVRLGLTALPNANAEAAGGLYTQGSGAGQINQPANGMVDVNAIRHLGTAYATPTTAGVPRVDVKAMEANTLTASALAADAVTEIVAGVFAYAHQAGRTFLGAIRRLDQLVTGKHTGMTGALWTLFDADGATTLVQATQDVAAGSRETASTIAGD